MKIKRIIAGFLVSITFFSAGPTYAFWDSNDAISNWYHQSFVKSKSKIEETTAKELDRSLQKLSTDIQKTMNNAEDQLIEFQKEKTADSEKSIKEHNEHYIQQIQSTKESLEQENEKEMQIYTEQTKEREAARITQDTEAILTELLEKQN